MAEGLEESPRWIERVLSAREAARGELGRDDAVLRGAADVQRFRHAAEAHADARRRARGDRERVRDLLRAQIKELRGRGRRTERADRARTVEALLVVIGMNSLRDLALDLEAD